VRTIRSLRLLDTLSYGFVTVLLFLSNACGGGGSGAGAPAVTSSIVVSPINGSVILTKTQQFTATAVLSDGTRQDVTGSVKWASSDSTIATVDSGGLVHGISRGTTNLSASSNQITGTTTVTSGGGILMKLPLGMDYSGAVPRISDGGRFVVFQSGFQIYEQDTCIGVDQDCTPQMLQVSVSSSGAAGNGSLGTMSGDGRFVAFNSNSENLVPVFLGPALYLRDMCVGPTAVSTCVPSTTLVSVDTSGALLPIVPCCQEIMPTKAMIDGVGRFVFFLVNDPIGAPTDPPTPPCATVYVRDTCNLAGSTCAPSTTNLSHLCGAVGKASFPPSLGESSGDGRYITTFTPFICGPHFGSFTHADVWDACTGVTACTVAPVFRVPEASDCSIGSGPSLSRTGRFLSFSNVSEPPGPSCATCVYDQCTGAPGSCSKGYTEAGIDINGRPLRSSNPIISADGRFVAISPGTYRDTCLQAPGPCTPETVTIPLVFQNSAVPGTPDFSMSSDARFIVLASPLESPGPVPLYVAITGLNLP
jgi:hypothetical protein